ncbi:MAG: FoF1 ATP synthase subunit gamma, partial [Patescibacteria group bacterium]
YIAVGQNAVSYLQKRVGPVETGFTKFGDYTTLEEVQPLADFLIDGYLTGRWDEVRFIATNFKSALSQEVIQRRVLPVDMESITQIAEEIIPKTGRFADMVRQSGFGFFQKAHVSGSPLRREYSIEPSPQIVLDTIIPYLVRMQVYHIILEANASEHAARRLAMKNASDNASEIVDNLTLEYNKSRQANITRELIEITGGVEAISH